MEKRANRVHISAQEKGLPVQKGLLAYLLSRTGKINDSNISTIITHYIHVSPNLYLVTP